jgi:hypothetical protein
MVIVSVALLLAVSGAAPAAARSTPSVPGDGYLLDWEDPTDWTLPDHPPAGWSYEYRPEIRHADGEPQVRVAHAANGEPVRNGQHSVRFDLEKSDPPLHNGSRAQLGAEDPVEPRGVERWYGFSTYLPASWTYDQAPEIVMQWHQVGGDCSRGCSPPLSIVTEKGQLFMSQNWEISPGNWHFSRTPIGPYETGRWTDWVVHVKWSTGNDGRLDVWKDGKPVDGFFNKMGRTDDYGDGTHGNYAVLGIYKWPWSQGKSSDTSRRIMYVDEFRVADERGTYDAVAPRGNSGPKPGHLKLATGLVVSPASPTAEQPVTVRFVITNDGGSPISVPYFLAGARDADGANRDFPSSGPVTLQPGDSYTYERSRTLSAGRHTAWPAYYDGSTWHELGNRTDFTVGERCQTATAGAPWPGEAFSPQSGRFTATLAATPLGAPIAAAVGLSHGAAQQWTGMAAIVLFDDVSGNIKARDGGAYTAVTPIPYQANVEYRVRFVVDVAAHRYSAYVTPPGGGEITIGTNLAFRTEQQAVTSLDTRTVAAGIGSLQACDLQISGASDTPSTTTVFALGDGADGSSASRELAGYVRAQNPDRFFYLGDVYATGTADEFARNYDAAYGAMAHKTDPVIGNHEYANRSSGYYPYWQRKRGWTSQQAKHRSYVTPEGWQVIAYSSEHDPSAESRWVGNELAKHAGTCRIAMAHKARHVVTDAAHGDNPGQEPIWSQIANKTAINLVGHNHIYGRLAPVNGVNVIVSGAGKGGLRSLGSQHHVVLASQNRVPTATKLVLRRGAADFQQVDKNGTVYDSGRITCEPPPQEPTPVPEPSPVVRSAGR